MLTGMKDSEPGWISSIDGALAHAVAHLGTQVSVTIAVLCALTGATVALGRFTRLGVLIAAIVGAVIWLAEDFGEIFTGQGTDPNSGLLLIVAAAAFWPFADVPPRKTDHARTRWASPQRGRIGPPPSAIVASQCRREEHGGGFLGLMAHLEPKGEQDSVRSRTGQSLTPCRGRNQPASQKEASRAHARLRAPGERANAQLCFAVRCEAVRAKQ